MGCWACGLAVREQAQWCAACGSMLRWHAWCLTRQIGAGGNGTAYMVERQGQLGVLKLPAAHVTPHEHQVECRNLYLAAALGVAPAPIETSPDGILMEYLPASSPLSLEVRAHRFLGVLNRLHNRQLVHRDVKSENVVPGGWQVYDLGAMVDLVRDMDVEPVGTPGYAPPEAYQGAISPQLDAYGAGWCLISWLGGPDPDPAAFGLPQGWTPPSAWDALVRGLVEPEPARRLRVALAYHTLTGPWCVLSGGARLASDLVTVEQWRAVLPGAPCATTAGYATALAPADVQRYLQATGTRLPRQAELRLLARGTERQPALRSHERMLAEGQISDVGARNCRRWLWQPVEEGVVWGGTPYADSDVLAAPATPNAMVGLRVARD